MDEVIKKIITLAIPGSYLWMIKMLQGKQDKVVFRRLLSS